MTARDRAIFFLPLELKELAMKQSLLKWKSFTVLAVMVLGLGAQIGRAQEEQKYETDFYTFKLVGDTGLDLDVPLICKTFLVQHRDGKEYYDLVISDYIGQLPSADQMKKYLESKKYKKQSELLVNGPSRIVGMGKISTGQMLYKHNQISIFSDVNFPMPFTASSETTFINDKFETLYSVFYSEYLSNSENPETKIDRVSGIRVASGKVLLPKIGLPELEQKKAFE